MNTVGVLIIGAPSRGTNKGRLLREVPESCGQKLTNRRLGAWVDIRLSQEMVTKAEEVGKPVALVNLDSFDLEVVDVRNSRFFDEEMASLPPSAGKL